MRVRYTRSAPRDVDAILDHISTVNEAAARAIMTSVDLVVARLAKFPRSAPETERPGVRMAPLPRHPYVIFYTIEDEEISIIHVRHGARRRPWESEH